jgi:hypothetical protein
MSVRHLIRRLVEPAPETTRRIPIGLARGVRMAAESSATAPADLWVGLFESEIARSIRRYAVSGTTCVDVGTNSGYYALALAARCRAPVFAYEPDPTARVRLERNLALNPSLAPLIDVSPAGLGTEATPGAVSLDADLRRRGALGQVGLLKIDVEGPEADVLAGARQLLCERRPHVVVETHSAALEDACARLLLQAGYRPRVLTQRRLLPEDRQAQEHNRWLVAAGR